jgi:hypothetical protein
MADGGLAVCFRQPMEVAAPARLCSFPENEKQPRPPPPVSEVGTLRPNTTFADGMVGRIVPPFLGSVAAAGALALRAPSP